MITSNIVFWLVWPLLLLIPFYFASRLYWKNKNPIEVTPDNARTPYVAGVSVLAIAIPLVANLTFEVSKTTQRFWIVGVLLAAMMFALVALVIGTILVYRFSIPLPSGNVEISESQAPWMQVQYTAMIFFLFVSFLGLVSFIAFGRSDSSPPSQVSQRNTVTQPLPVLGSDESKVLEEWGRPDVRGKTWLTYRTTDSTVVFCLEDLEDVALVEKVIVAEAKEDPDAVRMDCSTYR